MGKLQLTYRTGWWGSLSLNIFLKNQLKNKQNFLYVPTKNRKNETFFETFFAVLQAKKSGFITPCGKLVATFSFPGRGGGACAYHCTFLGMDQPINEIFCVTSSESHVRSPKTLVTKSFGTKRFGTTPCWFSKDVQKLRNCDFSR